MAMTSDVSILQFLHYHPNNNLPRLEIVDCMQGIAMTLVVVGHHLFPIMPEWYGGLHYYIYLFHMPLFIFLSGFLMGYAYKAGERATAPLVKSKLKKFLSGYISVGLLCVLLNLPHTGMAGVPKQLLMLLISPKESESTFLWYIYLLMIYYPLYLGILRNMRSKALLVVLSVSLVLQNIGISVSYFLLDYFFRFTPYFLAGILVSRHCVKMNTKVEAALCVCSLLFILLSLFHFKVGYQPVLEYLLSWAAIPAVYVVAELLARRGGYLKEAAVYVSKRCFGIYLLHMFFVQGFFLVLSRITDSLPASYAVVYVLVSTVLGICLSAFCWYNVKPELKKLPTIRFR